MDFQDAKFQLADLYPNRATRLDDNLNSRTWPIIAKCPPSGFLSKEKTQDLKSTLKFMSEEDRNYIHKLLQPHEDRDLAITPSQSNDASDTGFVNRPEAAAPTAATVLAVNSQPKSKGKRATRYPAGNSGSEKAIQAETSSVSKTGKLLIAVRYGL